MSIAALTVFRVPECKRFPMANYRRYRDLLLPVRVVV
jgi:hypothetical protein